ncbi:hypothetical protein ACFW2K_39345 [Streptomyces nigra]|uniref:hypothetical protein n=1 Tax=Streptomyces nigra TaxID=1827580 RepID=UPI0036CD662C
MRGIMIVCDLVSAVMYASVPIAGWLDQLTLTHLFIVALVCGTSADICRPSTRAKSPLSDPTFLGMAITIPAGRGRLTPTVTPACMRSGVNLDPLIRVKQTLPQGS